MSHPLTLGVIAHSSKENERRLPLHPLHLERLDEDLRGRVFLESGYADRFGIPDERLSPYVGGLRPRAELLADCDVILLAKPLAHDLLDLRPGQVLWGWPHCVQDTELTQHGIDRRLTLLAFEAMNHWKSDGSFDIHVFHKNNEIAGYCSVLQSLEAIGSTGDYGRRLNAVVMGFGATARGAITALSAHGITEVDVLTNRDVTAVGSPIHSATILHFSHDDSMPRRSMVHTDDGQVPIAEFLAGHDIIVNCVLQDTDAPLMFIDEKQLDSVPSGTLIVDVSCDEGMGFSWARATTFDEPTFVVGDNVTYYGVDHSPSFLWNSSSWEISEALLPYVRTVLDGPDAWLDDETLRRAVEIRDGVIQNPNILSFQNRSADYPHATL